MPSPLSSRSANIIRSAALFTSERYRKIADMAGRLSDADLTAMARAGERDSRRLAASASRLEVGSMDDATAGAARASVCAFIDELNRQCQLVAARGDINDSALYESKLREAYATLDELGARDAGQRFERTRT